jgi:hypothetical protein
LGEIVKIGRRGSEPTYLSAADTHPDHDVPEAFSYRCSGILHSTIAGSNHRQEDTGKTKPLRGNGFKIAWFVALVLVTLATMGASVPHQAAAASYAAPWPSSHCGDNSQVRLGQYLAAI